MTISDSAIPHAPRPLRHLSFTLTRADAVAYETLPREITGWRLILFLVWIGLAGMAVAMLPEDWVGEEGGWRFWMFMAAGGLVQYGLATLAMFLCRHWRAARRLPRPVAAELLDHVDHLEWRENGVPFFAAAATIDAVIVAAAHAFIRIGSHVLILPARAFASRHEMVAFAAELEERVADD